MKFIKKSMIYILVLFVGVIVVFSSSTNKVKAFESGNKIFGTSNVINDSLHRGFDSMGFETDEGFEWKLWEIYSNWSYYFGSKSNIYYFVKQPFNLVDQFNFLGLNAVIGDIILLMQTDIVLYNESFDIKASVSISELGGVLFHFVNEPDKNEEYWLGYSEGYINGKKDAEIIKEQDLVIQYNLGYSDARLHYGKSYLVGFETRWYTAVEWAQIEYNRGYTEASQGDNWFVVIMMFIWQFIAALGNWEILPNFKLVYVVGIVLVFGLIGFITNKRR